MAMRRRRTAGQKLVGWSILAGAALLILGIFIVTRILGSGGPAPSRAQATTSVAAASSSSLPASSDATSSAPASSSVAAPSSEPAPSSASAEDVTVVDPTLMNQGQRRAFLTTLIGQGVFTGIEIGSPPKVGVTPLFQGLSANLQQQFIATVYAYANNGATGPDALQIIDATTGKLAGSFTPTDGMKLL